MFPELGLSAYSCEDLFHQQALLDASRDALRKVAEASREIPLITVVEAAMLAGFLYLPPLAKLLGQAPPNEVGYLTALLAISAVLMADAAQKRWKRH